MVAVAHEKTGAGVPDESGVFVLAAIAMAALVVRLYGLSSESIWLDEATSIWLAKMSILEMVRWTAVDIHPPFYYAALHLWIKLLGDGEIAVRLLSVFAGVASVIVLYFLARRLFNPPIAFASATLLVFSPLHVWYSQETRMYAMLAFWGLLTSYCMVRALCDGRRWAWVAYIICTILMLYTHYYALFILLFQNVFALYLAWHGDMCGPVWRRWILAQAIAALAFVPWLPVAIHQIQSGGGAWVARSGVPGPSALVGAAFAYALGPDLKLYPSLLRRIVYVVSAILVVTGLVVAWRRRSSRPSSRSTIFCLIYLLVPVVSAWIVSQVKPLYSLRYLLPFLPPYYMLVAQGLDTLREASWHHLRADWLWGVALVVLLAIGIMGILGSAAQQQQVAWREITRYVTQNAGSSDIVIFVPGWNSKPFDYYARGRLAMKVDTPIPISATDAKAVVSQAAQDASRLWLVQAEGHYADPNNILRSYLDHIGICLDRQSFANDIIVSLYIIATSR